MNSLEVIRLIEDAWCEAPYPGDDKIVHPDSLDFDDIENYFRGTTWRGHSACDLRCHSPAFSYFTRQAFHYWLPAFMIAGITDPVELDVAGDCIPWALSDKRGLESWSLFSQSQRQAVMAYLRLDIDEYPEESEDERNALVILEAANAEAAVDPSGS
jgi:hypothetical protein